MSQKAGAIYFYITPFPYELSGILLSKISKEIKECVIEKYIMERQVGGINTEIRDLIRNNFYILNENNRQKKRN